MTYIDSLTITSTMESVQSRATSSHIRPRKDVFDLEPYLSIAYLEELGLTINIGYYSLLHPYKWTKDDGFRYMPVSKGVFVHALIFTTYYVYLLLRMIYLVFNGGLEVYFMVFIFSIYSIEAMMLFNIWLYKEEFAMLHNGMVYFLQGFVPYALEHYPPQPKTCPEVKMGTIFMKSFRYWVATAVPTYIFLAIFAPEVPFFLSALLDDPWSIEAIPVRILAVFMSGYIHYVLGPFTFILFNTISTFAVVLLPMLKHMKERPDNEKTWLNDIKWYNQARLLLTVFNEIHGTFILPPLEWILIICSVFGLYGAVRLTGVSRAAMVSSAYCGFFLLAILFRLLAEIATRSEDLLDTWKNFRDRGYGNRVLRAQRPLHVQLLRSFIDIPLLLTIMDIILNNAIALLLV